MNWKLLIPFVLILALQVQGNCFASETSPATAVSPTDGSLWMATESDGLLRFGRNGRVIKYPVIAQSLVFDASGTLYILDAAGTLTRYTSVEGFSVVPSFEAGVGALSESAGIPYIIKDSLLYSLSGDSPEVLRTLPFSISSASLPEFEYEEEAAGESDSSQEEKGTGISPLLWIAVGLCLGFVLGLLLFRRRPREDKKEKVPVSAPSPAPVVKKPVEVASVQKAVAPGEEASPQEEAESAPLGIEEALKSSEFGRKVWDLVISNLSNSAYGVEQAALDLEISRIHVNRKLKAETGYSPSAVFKFIRMNYAASLLLEGKLSIADVARECGFASASYFSTAFKDYYKKSPSEFVAAKSHQTGTLDLQ